MLEKLTKAKKLEKAKELFVDAVSKDLDWQREAREDFLFRDGIQWSDEEVEILKSELRPVLTFNLTKSSVDLIMGMSEDNKVVYRATPVDPDDGFLAEVLNDCAEWSRDSEDFGDEEDAALESSAICGRGFVAIDFVPDPNRFGEIVMQEVVIPVHEVHLDPASRRNDMSDAGYICWDRWLSREDFLIRYPKMKEKDVEELLAQVTTFGTDGGPEARQAVESDPYVGEEDTSDYSKSMDYTFYDQGKNQIRVVHMEHWETFERIFMYDPQAGKFTEVDPKDKKATAQAVEEATGQKAVIETLRDKRVRWLQFTGNEILYDDVSPLPYPGFSICNMFAFSDISKRSANHFGIVRLMKDPQREINKRWSQTLNMLNNQVQPGVYAETDTFVDNRQAEQSMKEAGGITYVNSGAISGGRLKERTVPAFPSAPMQMEQYSQDIMKKITGINPDLLGQDRGRQEPGVVVRMRQQQGITLLKPLFRNFNKMKKQLFKRQLAIIMQYMPDEQIMRILGNNERYQIDPQTGNIVDQQSGLQANIRDVRNLEYNIGAEEAPGNMTKRMMELQAFMEMQQGGMPVPPQLIIEKMDIAESDKRMWLKYIEDQNAAQSEQQAKMMQAEMEIKQKELSTEEQKVMNDFIIGIAKINQMTEKDRLKMQQSVAQMGLTEKRDMLGYIQGLAQIAQQATGQSNQMVHEQIMNDQKIQSDQEMQGQQMMQQMMQMAQQRKQGGAQQGGQR